MPVQECCWSSQQKLLVYVDEKFGSVLFVLYNYVLREFNWQIPVPSVVQHFYNYRQNTFCILQYWSNEEPLSGCKAAKESSD